MQSEKAYWKGEGLKMTYEELSNAAPCQQNETGCNVVTGFILPVKIKGKSLVSLIKEDNTPEERTYTKFKTIQPASSHATFY